MSATAMGLPGIHGRRIEAPERVGSCVADIQVIRVDAQKIPAEVVYLHSVRDGTNKKLIADSMRPSGATP